MVLLDVTRRVEARQADEAPTADEAQKAETVMPVEGVGRSAKVGDRIRSARLAHGWDIDELVRRTALSPRILRGIEADDFAACGGDCYARGHLRILARALSLDEAPLLAAVPVPDPLADQDEQDSAHSGRRPHAPASLLALAAVLVVALMGLLLLQTVFG